MEREHASEGLLRSVMKNGTSSGASKTEEKKKPAISFGQNKTQFRPLENRPVMPLPPGEGRPPRRDGRGTPNSAGTSTQQAGGQHRLRDDVKPMFQRDIGYSTPSRDGTAKK